MKFKKGDQVIIAGGKDRGKTGKIELVFPRIAKVLVSGINVYKKHQKARGQRKPGGIIDVTRPLPVANIALLCPQCHMRTRVGFKITGSKKVRICKKCQGELT